MELRIRKPNDSFLLSIVVYFMTIYSLYMQFDGYDNYQLKVISYLAMAGLVMFSCLRTRLYSISDRTILGFILFIVIVSVTSIFVAPSFSTMWYRLFDMIVYTVFLVAIYISCNADKNRIYVMLWAIVLSALLCSFALSVRGVDNRTGGLVLGNLNQNEFSNIALLGTFCALFLFNSNKQYKLIIKLFLFASVIFIAYAGLLGGSRKFFVIDLAMILAFFLFCVFTRDTFQNRSTFGWCVFGAIALVIIANYGIDYAMTQTIFGQRLSDTGYYGDTERIYFYKKAWEYFIQNPLFGLGINGFAYYEGKYSHSIYMELLSCTGVLGTSIFFSTMISLFKRCINLMKIVGDADKKNIRFVVIYLLAILINGFFTPVIYATYFYIAFGLIMAIVSDNEICLAEESK